MSAFFLQVDVPAILVAVLASVICSFLGSFLVLRRQAMVGDALSHAVLPGLAVAFILSGSLQPHYMILGALAACLVSVMVIRLLQSVGKVENGAAIGITLTAMFALGVVLLEAKIGSRVHLDAHHALYGSLELTYWPAPFGWGTLPVQIKALGFMLLGVVLLILVLFKEFKLTSFDPLFANSQGFSHFSLSLLLMLMTALAVVLCFEAVGSILVIALLVCPAATARMLCDDLKTQLWLSAVIGAICAVTGYVLAALPSILGYGHSLSAAGMIALSAGGYQLAAMLWAPRYGYIRQKKSLVSKG